MYHLIHAHRTKQLQFNPLASGRCGSNFQSATFKHMLSSWTPLVKLLSRECQRTHLILSQNWFRWWCVGARQRAIIWSNVDQDLYRHMTSLDHSLRDELVWKKYINYNRRVSTSIVNATPVDALGTQGARTSTWSSSHGILRSQVYAGQTNIYIEVVLILTYLHLYSKNSNLTEEKCTSAFLK